VPVDPASVGQKCRWLLGLTLLAEYQPMIRIREVSLAEFRDSDCLSVDFPLFSRVVTGLALF
jgi:hypothetical protein